MFDRFFQGVKPKIRLEVLTSQASEFEESAKIALRVDSALWSSTNYSKSSFECTGKVHDHMEIGNVQSRIQTVEDKKGREGS